MGLLDNLKQQIGNQLGSQFIEIIQWLDDTNDSLVYRFPVYNQEIKMNAQLTVRENQAALFINEGKAADLFTPGRYELTTQNIPILTDPPRVEVRLPVALQGRGLLLQHAPLHGPEVGHDEPRHDARRGVRDDPPARLRDLRDEDRRPEDSSSPRSSGRGA